MRRVKVNSDESRKNSKKKTIEEEKLNKTFTFSCKKQKKNDNVLFKQKSILQKSNSDVN